MALVQTDGGYSETLLVPDGVKQGCVMSPTPFRMMFSDMLTNTFRTMMVVSQSSTALKAIQCTNHKCEWLKVVDQYTFLQSSAH